MTAMKALASDDPIMLAWKAYKTTEEAENTRRWATHFTIEPPRDGQATIQHPYLSGSLWAVFLAGYNAGAASDKEDE